jgi:putative oxidoreductase
MALLKNLGNYKNFGLLIIRVGPGILFIYHGLPKLTGGPGKWEHLGNAAGSVGIHFLPTFWGFICALTETLGGVLVLVGLAAIEDAVTFAGLVFLGPGKYSVDKT